MSDRRRGSVLILALWALFFLAALALSVGAHVSAGLGLAEAMINRARAYHLARAGVALAASLVASNTNTWDALSEDAWNNDAVFHDNEELSEGLFSVVYARETGDEEEGYRYGVIGEERSINIARGKTDRGLLLALFRHVGGTSASKAEAIVDAITDWAAPADRRLTSRKEPGVHDGYEKSEGRHGDSLQSVYELLLIKGIDRDLFERIKPFVTIHGSGKINVNVAPREVLLCVAVFKGADRLRAERAVDEIIRVRPKARLSDFHQDLSEAGSRVLRSMMGLLTVNSTCFRGTAVGRAGRLRPVSGSDDITESRITFVLDADGREQYWHEH